jgi:hypothetical protein
MNRPLRGSAWLRDTLATRTLERLKPNMGAAGERINDARRHVASARLLAESDVTLALAACHDAIRKAITAHMSASGYRPHRGEGAHKIVLDYARHELPDAITADDLADAERIRRDRALAEYGEFAARQITSDHVRRSADVAERVVNAVASALASSARPPQAPPA